MVIYIGTSGYLYNFWKDSFYPINLPKGEYLQYYSNHFNTVEINNTFYKSPTKEIINNWYNSTPNDFKFSIKVNMYITHYKKLKNINKPLKEFINLIKNLKNKLGCLLFQFHHNFKFTITNFKRLKKLKNIIPPNIKCAFEFRDNSWYNDTVYDFFSNITNWTIAIIYIQFGKNLEYGFNPKSIINNNNFFYFRLHGSNGQYIGSHDLKILNQIKKIIKNKNAYIYFNNTDSISNDNIPDAVKDAQRMTKIIKK